MSIPDGRAAVQERLDALDQERAALTAILTAYERLEALTQPERTVVAASAPAPAPAAVPSPPGEGSPAIHQPEQGKPRPRLERPSPAPTLVDCPDCDTQVKSQGLGTHRRLKHNRVVPTVLPKNPRSVASLDLPPRMDSVVGE
jgi:hypothetical protein